MYPNPNRTVPFVLLNKTFILPLFHFIFTLPWFFAFQCVFILIVNEILFLAVVCSIFLFSLDLIKFVNVMIMFCGGQYFLLPVSWSAQVSKSLVNHELIEVCVCNYRWISEGWYSYIAHCCICMVGLFIKWCFVLEKMSQVISRWCKKILCGSRKCCL